MRILVVWPPQVPSYFNAGHHLGVFCTSAYLRARDPGRHVDALDAGVLNMNWKTFADTLYQGAYEVVALANDFDAVDGLPRAIRYARQVLPHARIVTFGRLSNSVPEFFHRFDLDAIVATGDYETGVDAAVSSPGPGPGVWARVDGEWRPPTRPGVLLPPDAWALPDIHEIPYGAYHALYGRDADKFCGIPARRELVVPAARGCPIGCSYCEVPGLQGKRDRRLPVARTVAYIEESFAALPFEYVAMYAPTFTLDRRWVVELCEALLATGRRYPWKCATTLGHLDEELVSLMGRAGCVRVSVGLETLDPQGHRALPRVKQIAADRFTTIAGWCDAAGIELNAFVIVGLPGTDAAAARATAAHVAGVGARFRPTMYTPMEELRPDMAIEEVGLYNRHTVFGDHPPEEVEAMHELVFGTERRISSAIGLVPQRQGTAL
ncbi:B12-binding domain-containing radical SAM protein [Micromonospora echinofusca]|uniref:B12-binding domain-containing radical SAM protein n=1 Tax=Micromonospora echinofusca TaxID=47858 RepID=UPI0033E54D93